MTTDMTCRCRSWPVIEPVPCVRKSFTFVGDAKNENGREKEYMKYDSAIGTKQPPMGDQFSPSIRASSFLFPSIFPFVFFSLPSRHKHRGNCELSCVGSSVIMLHMSGLYPVSRHSPIPCRPGCLPVRFGLVSVAPPSPIHPCRSLGVYPFGTHTHNVMLANFPCRHVPCGHAVSPIRPCLYRIHETAK
jgi:hypothetical protein